MSSDSLFVSATSFDASTTLGFSTPKVNSAGGKNVNLMNNNTKKQVVLSTPLILTWGLSEFKDDTTGKCTYDMSLQFPSDNYPNEQASLMLEKLKDYENKIKETAVEKCKEWFNKPSMSPDVVDALWTPMLRYRKGADGMPDESSAPNLRVKVPYWQEKWKCEIYGMNNEVLYPNEEDVTPMELIPKLANVALIIQSGGIWFANGKFGTTWKLVQAKVKPRASLMGKCHIQLTTDEREKLESQKEDDNYQPTQVVDSDDEDSPANLPDSEDNVEDSVENSQPEVVEQVPQKKKRVVKKKGSED